MGISALTARQGKVNITVEVVEIGEPRTFNKSGTEGRVANAVVKDETGTIKLSLWNDEIEKVQVGSKVTIENGYVNEWQGELQLSAGKFGTLKIAGAE